MTSDGSSVIVTCYEVRKLKEYTTHGNLVREILLQEDMTNPHHAVQLTSGQFVVCHGELSDRLHRVCLVDANGCVRKYFGGQKGSAFGQMNVPARLVVDQDGSILVADVNNARVLILTESLDHVRKLITRRDVTSVTMVTSRWWRPARLRLDERRAVLYVAEVEWYGKTRIAGQLVVYKVGNTLEVRFLKDFNKTLYIAYFRILYNGVISEHCDELNYYCVTVIIFV